MARRRRCEMALVAAEPRRAATVAALEQAETFAVYRREFDALRRKRPQVTELLLGFLANEVRVQNERLLEALYVPVERRVLRRLVELAAPSRVRPHIRQFWRRTVAAPSIRNRPRRPGIDNPHRCAPD